MKRMAFNVVEVDGHVVSIVEEPADFALNLWDERTSPLSSRSLSFHFVELGARARSGGAERWPLYRAELDWLTERVQRGEIVPPTVRVMGPLGAETARRAHTLLAKGHAPDDPEPFERGINHYTFVHDGIRWRLTHLAWEVESPQHPLPPAADAALGQTR